MALGLRSRVLAVAAAIAIAQVPHNASHVGSPLRQCPLSSLSSDSPVLECYFAVRLEAGYTFTVNGVTAPELTLRRGTAYRFRLAMPDDVPFILSETEDGSPYEPRAGADSHVCAIESGPAFPGQGVLRLMPGADTPTELWYASARRSGMGNRIRVPRTLAQECPDFNASTGNGSSPYGSAAASSSSSDDTIIYAHAVVMYVSMGLLLPFAAYMAHIGRTFKVVGGAAFSAHKTLSPLAVLIACVGASLAFVDVERKPARAQNHFDSSHAVIGLLVLIFALLIQPFVMMTGWLVWHRRQGAVILVAAYANIFQGMYLLQVDFAVQVAQIALTAVLLMAYILYRPSPSRVSSDQDALSVTPRPSEDGPPAPPVPVQPQAPRTLRIAGGATSQETGTDHPSTTEVEQQLLNALPCKMAEKRRAAPPQRPGCLSRADLSELLGGIISKHRLQLNREEMDDLTEAVLSYGDTDNDGIISLAELQSILCKNGLSLSSGGKLERSATPPEWFEPPADVAESKVPAAPAGEAPAAGDAFAGPVRPAPSDPPMRKPELQARIHNNLPVLFWSVLFFLCNVVCFVVNFGHYACWFDADTCEAAPVAVQVAKGAGMALNFTCAVIVLPMCRKTLTFLRSFKLVRRCVPLDSAYDFHLLVGWTIVSWTVVHVVSHYINYLGNSEVPTDTMITSAPGFTGHMLLAILLLMAVTALPRFRRVKLFHVFMLTHHLFIVFFVLLFVHGTGFIGPNYWKFAIVPLAIYFAERAQRLRDTDYSNELQVVTCRQLPGDVTHLEMRKPPGFGYLPGQYCFVAVPAVSGGRSCALEFHPFTISSAPHEENISLHIRKVGDWTSALHALAGVPGAVDRALLDGPYGSASEEVFGFEVAVMVGAGIGVTPFASILKDIRYKLETLSKVGLAFKDLQTVLEVFLGSVTTGRRSSHLYKTANRVCKLRNLYFFWTTRDRPAFQWFGDLLSALHSEDTTGDRGDWSLEIRTFLTGVKNLDKATDLGSLFLNLSLRVVHEQLGKCLLSGHNRGVTFGRPDWDAIFRELAAKHPGKHVGVFFCGPEVLANELRQRCATFSGSKSDGETRFSFHTEIF